MKILLVDDDNFLRDMYAIKFSQGGHEIDAVDSGSLALSRLEQGNLYDAILLDMVMPGMTGLELLHNIKANFVDYPARMIVLSNQGQEEDIREALDAGATAYIIKAESVPSEVLAKVEEICQ